MDMALIEVPYDSGWRDQRMGGGPARLLSEGAADRVRGAAGGTVEKTRIESDLAFPTEVTSAFDLAAKLSASVGEARRHGRFPLVLAGNCMSSVGTLSGLADIERIGVVWFDAHGDLNTPETSPQGFLDGMAGAVLTGRCWQAPVAMVPGYRCLPDARLLHVGGRDLDPAEVELLNSGTIPRVDGSTFAAQGADALAAPLKALARDVDAVYLHLDLDVHDAETARFSPYAAPDGPSPEQVRQAVAAIAAQVPIAAAALTAYAPDHDTDGTACTIALELLETVATCVARQPDRA